MHPLVYAFTNVFRCDRVILRDPTTFLRLSARAFNMLRNVPFALLLHKLRFVLVFISILGD